MLSKYYMAHVSGLRTDWKFVAPKLPETYNPAIRPQSPVAGARMEATWDTRREEHKFYLGVEDAMKLLIINAYALFWIEEIEDNVLDFTHMSAFEILEHLLTQCLKLTNREKRAKLIIASSSDRKTRQLSALR